MRRRGASAAALVLVAGMVLGTAAPAGARVKTPSGYRRAAGSVIAPGVEYVKLARGRHATVHVAKVSADAPVFLRSVVSKNRVSGRPETTSSMCKRVKCLVAVNGDFFNAGTPVGGMVTLGELLRSPTRKRPQLAIGPDGKIALGKLKWTGTIVSSDLDRAKIRGVNVRRGKDQIVLYTRSFGPATRTRGGVELGIRFVEPEGRMRLGETTVVRVYRLNRGKGNTYIPPGGAVLSGHGKGATELMNIWRQIQSDAIGSDLLLRLDSRNEVADSIAGKAVLIRGGKIVIGPRDGGRFARADHPRTAVGWNDRGDVWMVTVDGRQKHSAGMSLREAAVMLRRLGATEAMNLDGGGSSTFVVNGRVVNKPSGGSQRPVANALAVVPEWRSDKPDTSARAVALGRMSVPKDGSRPKAAALVDGADAGSYPALVAQPEPDPYQAPLEPIAAAMTVLVGTGLFFRKKTVELRRR